MSRHSVEELSTGLQTWITDQGFRVVELHYTANPRKRTEEWKKQASMGISRQDWQVEYEISFATRAGKPVFADFVKSVHVKAVEPIAAPVWVGWDFGYHIPAVTALQVNDFGQLRFGLSIIGQDMELKNFAKNVVLPHLAAKYPGNRDLRYCVDVAGRQERDSGESSINVLSGIVGAENVFSKWSEIEIGLGIIRSKIATRKGVEPLLIIDPSCTLLIQGAEGGWVYLFDSARGDVKPEPDSNSIYKHPWDAARYAVLFANPDEGEKRFQAIVGRIPSPTYLVSKRA